MLHNAYLNFDGLAEEAMTFYAGALGKDLDQLTRFDDAPPRDGYELPEAAAKKIMHVRIPLGDGQALMASDVVPEFGHTLTVGNNMYVSLHPETVGEGEKVFAALSNGGEVEAPFGPAPWGDHWGAFKDKFGVQWMINVAGAQED